MRHSASRRNPAPPTPPGRENSQSGTGHLFKSNGINMMQTQPSYRVINGSSFFRSFSFIFGPFVSIFDAKQGLNQRNRHRTFPGCVGKWRVRRRKYRLEKIIFYLPASTR